MISNIKKIALLDSSYGNVDKNRFIILAQYLNYGIENVQSLKINKQICYRLLLIDDMSLKNFLKISFLVLTNSKIKFELVSLELYNISFRCLLQEFKNKNFSPNFLWNFSYAIYLLLLRFSKFFLLSLILSRCLRIFIPSTLRINFLKKRKKLPMVLLRNLPPRDFSCYKDSMAIEDQFSIKNDFIFLPGRINNPKELNLTLEFALKNNLKIVICSTEKIDLITKNKFRSIIIETGILPHDKIISLMRKCLAGVLIYNSNTLNQRFSASSKLFEFLFFNKPVIISSNEGVLEELKNMKYKSYFLINELSNIDLSMMVDEVNDQINNDSCLFENEILKISNL